jgi:alpha-beta hydrolase superfamily lysophospholipase
MISSKPELVEISSTDNLTVYGMWYPAENATNTIVLCHQARWNKTEYKDIAPQLVEMGFNCLAIDQRSGGDLHDEQNQTFEAANKAGLSTDYLDAEPDIIAAVEWAASKTEAAVILWGSSYSSTLALYIAAVRENVKAVISFSPGNYMADKKGDLKTVLGDFTKPAFVTSSKSESLDVGSLLESFSSENNQIQFIPKGAGEHGSRALWKEKADHQEYWDAISTFLYTLN